MKTDNLREFLKDKYLGALVGFAIGDAMGGPAEFMTKEQIKEKYGVLKNMVGGGWLGLKPGEVTDDTQMMVAVIEALTEYAINPKCDFKKTVADKFVEWYMTKPKDVGNCCAVGIEYYLNTSKFIPFDSTALGNGGLMRALPCFLFGSLELNFLQNNVTHNSYMSINCIRRYHEFMNKILFNGRITAADDDMEEKPNPTGKVTDTFTLAKHWTCISNSFYEAIVNAINDGGDADTIGAITGSMAGLRYGFNGIVYDWFDCLDKNLFKKLDEFADLAVEHAMDRMLNWC